MFGRWVRASFAEWALGFLLILVLLEHGAAWILASVAGWSLAGSTVMINERLLPTIPGIVGALLYIGVVPAGGIAIGVIGGLALHRILKPETVPAS